MKMRRQHDTFSMKDITSLKQQTARLPWFCQGLKQPNSGAGSSVQKEADPEHADSCGASMIWLNVFRQ